MSDQPTAPVLHLPFRAHAVIPPRDERDWVTSHELIQAAGISYRQCDYWTRTGLLTTLEEPTPGSGSVRRYHEQQVTRAKALQALLGAGVALTVCRDVIDEFTETGRVQVGAIVFAVADREAAS